MSSWLYTVFIYPIELLIDFLFSLIYHILGSVGFSLIALGLVVSLLVLPLYLRADALQAGEREKQKKMEKWVRHIRETFRGEERTMMLFACYRENDYHPLHALRGSFSLLLQIPFFMAAYQYLSRLSLLQESSFRGIQNLGAPDALLQLGGVSINLLPLLMTAINLVSGALYTRGFAFKDKLQTYGISLLFLALLYNSPAGLVLYWTTNNLFSLGKNLFLKISRHPTRDASILAALGGASFAALMVLRGKIYDREILVFCILAVILSALPLLLVWRGARGAKPSSEDDAVTPGTAKTLWRIQLLSSICLALLYGAVIPLTVISSSPVEFILLSEGNRHPLLLVVQSLSVSAGVFVVWLLLVYYLASHKGKRIVVCTSVILLAVSLVNHFFFYRDVGSMTTAFRPANGVWTSQTESVLNLAVDVLLLLLLLFWWKKRSPRKLQLTRSALALLCLTLAVFCGYHCVTTQHTLRTKAGTGKNPATEEYNVESLRFSLSPTEKNVIVLMLDRGISPYVPYIFAEDPSLQEAFSGFVYYPNTISYSVCTVFGSPAIYGGYEYSPARMNARDTEPLAQKHREALRLLPALFSAEGHPVTVVDPPYSGWDGENDTALYADYPGVSLSFTGAYYMRNSDTILTEVQYQRERGRRKHNMFFYPVMRCLPRYLQPWLFRDGTYFSIELERTSSGDYMKEYAALAALPSLTETSSASAGTLVLMDNRLPHEPEVLQLPDYEPAITVNNTPYLLSWLSQFEGKVPMETRFQIGSYHVNAATFHLLADWFRTMKELGVYDNTRIILVSDHGTELEQFPELMLSDEVNVERVGALLMVKDFDAEGFATDERFMTTADVVPLATQEVVKAAVNPFTGNPIDVPFKEEPQIITFSYNHRPGDQNETTYVTDDAPWYTVQDNIFSLENWEKLAE